MKYIDYRMWLGLVIHALICFSLLGGEEPLFFYVTLPFVILNIIGILLITLNQIKAGAIVFIIGSIGFVPIGLIGVFGGRSALDKLKQNQFHNTLNLSNHESN